MSRCPTLPWRCCATALLALLAGCGPSGGGPRWPAESFSVTCTGLELLDETGQWRGVPFGTEAEPIPFSQFARVWIEVRALPEDRAFDGLVRVSVEPGFVFGLVSPSTQATRTSIRVVTGTSTTVGVEIGSFYGPTRLWVEDIGLVPGDPVGAACDDGMDNDGDGLADYPTDPGCFFRNDVTEEGGSHSVGVSDTLWFSSPRLAEVQGCGPISPLAGEAVNVDRGGLYVTRILSDGFTVSDLAYMRGGCDAESPCCVGGRFSHIFVYNFNTPYGLRVCDRLASVGGALSDFYGYTELNFPAWSLYDLDQNPENGITLMRNPPSELTPELCPIEAHELSEQDIFNARIMESWEAGLVEVTNVLLPSPEDWIDCDYNGDGEAEYRVDEDVCVPRSEIGVGPPYCTTDDVCCEAQCVDVCESRLCTELSGYRAYGQFMAQIGQARVLMETAEGVPDFDPRTLASTPSRTIDRVTGTLSAFDPLPTPWIIEPRCRQDIYVAGDERYPDVPVYRRCIPSTETGEYEDPYM